VSVFYKRRIAVVRCRELRVDLNLVIFSLMFVGRVSAFPSIARLLVLLGYVSATEKMI
jgi:hypothetical protein